MTEHVMKTIIMACLAAGVFAGSAIASPLTLTRKTVDDGWVRTRMICDQFGRCWKEHNRNALLDSYNFAPPPRVHAIRQRANWRERLVDRR
jgi:hypothetical protein